MKAHVVGGGGFILPTRSARQAVSALLGLSTRIPPVYQGQRDPKALLEAMKVMA